MHKEASELVFQPLLRFHMLSYAIYIGVFNQTLSMATPGLLVSGMHYSLGVLGHTFI